MGCGQNSGRCFLLTVCSLQLVTTTLRQVFDFLGFMWLPIIANFFNFIFVIFGFFGAYQYKPKYILIYVIWLVAWVSWNVFVTCFYLNVGLLNNRDDWLNFGTGSASWWEVNGPGCRPLYPSNLTNLDPYRPLRPERVDGCFLDYQYVETLHAALQCLLAVLGVAVSLYLLAVLTEEDDTCKTKTRATSIFSVEYSPNTEDSGDSIDLDDNTTTGTLTSHYNTNNSGSTFLPQPPQHGHHSTMTPRRVKRHQRNRCSARSSRQAPPTHPTPETNFANNYTAAGASSVPGPSGSLAGVPVGVGAPTLAGGSGVSGGAQPPGVSTITGRSHGRSSQRRSAHNRQSGRTRRPQYLNPVTQLMDDSSTSTDSQKIVGMSGGIGIGSGGRLGHSNPMYVHSRPGSLHSLVSTDPVERPPSVRSSYSNYHGVGASLNQTAAAANNIASAIHPIANLPHGGGLNFNRANQGPGKALNGSQNSILSAAEQRRRALTASEIRVPTTSMDNNNPSTGGVNNVQAQANNSGQYNGSIANNNNQLSPTSITSVTNISPSSIISSSHNTTQSSNPPYQHLQPNAQQQNSYAPQLQHNNQLHQQHNTAQNQFSNNSNTSNTHQYNTNNFSGNSSQQYNSQQGVSNGTQNVTDPRLLPNSNHLNPPQPHPHHHHHNHHHPQQQLYSSPPSSPQYTSIAPPMEDPEERPPPYVFGVQSHSAM